MINSTLSAKDVFSAEWKTGFAFDGPKHVYIIFRADLGWFRAKHLRHRWRLSWGGIQLSDVQGCGVGSPVIRLRAISIIRLRPSAVLVT